MLEHCDADTDITDSQGWPSLCEDGLMHQPNLAIICRVQAVLTAQQYNTYRYAHLICERCFISYCIEAVCVQQMVKHQAKLRSRVSLLWKTIRVQVCFFDEHYSMLEIQVAMHVSP